MVATASNTNLWRSCDTVERLLKKNQLPSDKERSILSKEISYATAALTTATDRKPSDSESQKDRARIQAYINTCQSLLSPLRGLLGLPNELLGQIFVWLLPLSEDDLTGVWVNPLILSQICRHWRNVAVSTPALWSCLPLSHPYSPGHGHTECMKRPPRELVELFVSRAAKHPLMMWLSYRYMGPNWVFIEENALRCTHLALTLHKTTNDTVCLLDAAELPLLEDLELMQWPPLPDGSQIISTVTTRLPRLRSFRSSTGSLDICYSFAVPWSQLTVLDLLLPTQECLERFPAIIAACRDLLDLTFSVDLPFQSNEARAILAQTVKWPEEHSVIRLPKLKSLSISSRMMEIFSVPQFICGFVNALMVPRLETLYLDYFVGPLTLWTEMITRSQCTLQCVEVKHGCAYIIEFDHLISLLTSISSVRQLKFNASYFICTPRVLALLHYLMNGTPSATDPSLTMPHLNDLFFTFWCRSATELEEFREKIQVVDGPTQSVSFRLDLLRVNLQRSESTLSD